MQNDHVLVFTLLSQSCNLIKIIRSPVFRIPIPKNDIEDFIGEKFTQNNW